MKSSITIESGCMPAVSVSSRNQSPSTRDAARRSRCYRPVGFTFMFVLLTVATSAGPLEAQVTDGGPRYAASRARRLMDEYNFSFAKTHLLTKIVAYPEDSELHILLGEVCHALEQYEDAVPAFKKGIALDTKVVSKVPNYPLTLFKLGRLDDALVAYKRMSAEGADRAKGQGYYGVGLVKKHQGKLAEAEAALKRSLTYMPKSPKVNYHLGLVLRRLGKLKEAIERFETVVERDGLHLACVHNLALTWRQLGDKKKSREWQKKYREVGRDAELASTIRRRLAQNRGTPAMRGQLADIYFRHRRFEQSKGLYQALTAVRFQPIESRYRWAVCHYQTGDPRMARVQLENVLRQAPNHGASKKLHAEIVEKYKGGYPDDD